MGDRDGPTRPHRWPTLLLVAGMAGLLPMPSLRRGFVVAEELLLSARRSMSLGSLGGLGGSTAAALAAADAHHPGRADGPEPRVVALLAQSRAALLPPRSTGWQRDGRFCVVPVGADRRPESLSLLLAGTVPQGEPVFSGRVLIGTTALDRAQRPYVVPILAKGARVPACAGIPGRREVRFLAVGDGSPTLRVQFPDGSQPILDGDLVWAIDVGTPAVGAFAPIVAGAELGRIERGELPVGAQRDDWRVRPTVSLELLVEVAILFPPGLPGPAETELAPLPVRPLGATVRDVRRSGAWLDVGRELGVVAGCAVASGPCLAGIVQRAGWHGALVRRLDDPGFRCRALVLVDGQCLSWTIEVVAREGDHLLLRGAPPAGNCDGALLVTAGSAAGVPEGLILGVVETAGGTSRLRVEAASIVFPREQPWVVHRPPGPWSTEG